LTQIFYGSLSKSIISAKITSPLTTHVFQRNANTMAGPTYALLIAQFTTFLTVAIHTILYERGIYPKESFLSARKYNFPVRQSRHPKVCRWITDAVSAVEAELLRGTVARVAVVIVDPATCHPLERFMFDMSKLPVVPANELNTPFHRDDDGPVGVAQGGRLTDRMVTDLEEQLRAVMSKLAVCSNRLKPIPPGCTYTVSIELKDESDPPIRHPQPWVPAQPSLQKSRPGMTHDNNSSPTRSREGVDLGGSSILSVRTVDAGEMIFEMWIEEGKAKGNIVQSSNSTE